MTSAENERDGAAVVRGGGGTQRRHSTVLSHSSSESALPRVDSTSATEFLKGAMWGKSKIPSSSTSMMGMSRLQRESGGGETDRM